MTKPLEQSSDLQLHESFDYSQSERVDLTGTLETLGGDEPGKVKYLRESTDGQYSIYKYIVATGGNKGGIKNRYVSQVGPWVEGTQFTDANGDELEQDRFGKGDVVYLRVPKNKETRNVPGQFDFVKKYKDNQNRHWKLYSYTLKYGGTYEGIQNRYRDQFGIYESLFPGRNFCDKNGVVLEDDGYHRIDEGETVYVKVPDRDVIDNIPEMTMDDIYSLSDDKIMKIFENYEYERFGGSYFGGDGGSMYEHADKKGDYIVINGKKLYVDYGDRSVLNRKKPCCLVLEVYEGGGSISLGAFDGKKFNGIFYGGGAVTRGTFDLDNLF